MLLHKKTSKKKSTLPPYLNKSLNDLPGEKWDFIPDFEDSYMVSNYGRVKSLARIIYYKNGVDRHRRESILSPGVTSTANTWIGDHTHVLSVILWYEGRTKSFSIRRLVYYCFVEKINLSDLSIVILCKDGNGLNLYYENLEKASCTEQQERIYKRERSISCFTYLDMKSNAQKGIAKRMKQVSQYSLQGEKLAVYPSIKFAAEATGISKTTINGVAGKRRLTAGNYIWQYGDGAQTIDLSNYWGNKRAIASAKRRRKVTQYDMQGRVIAHFESITAASQATGDQISAISKCLSGELHSSKGFVWKSGTRHRSINPEHLMSRDKFFAMLQKKVAQYTLDDKYITCYESIRKAAQAIGVHETGISAAARGISKSSGGYCWKFM